MSIKIKGADKLIRKLDDLAKRDARKASRAAAREAGKAMRNELKPYVPIAEGILAKATTFKVIGKGNNVGAIAGADVNKLQPTESRPTNVDWLVEFGHVSPDGVFVPPHPYLRRNAEAINRAGERAYIATLKAGIEGAL